MPKRPAGEVRESKDFSTGYRTVTHDINVEDRLPHEPYGLRAQAREYGRNAWTVAVTHGPFEERDEQGSYYRTISHEQFSGPLGAVKTTLRRAVGAEWDKLRG